MLSVLSVRDSSFFILHSRSALLPHATTGTESGGDGGEHTDDGLKDEFPKFFLFHWENHLEVLNNNRQNYFK